VLPGEDAPAVQMPVHQHCLVEAGVYLIENLLLSSLADAGIAEFCFILLPVKFKGATGSPARPVAMF
jgi:kynurenine formamidase